MLAVWDHIESPLAYAIPFFFAFIGIEAALLRVAGDHETRTGYSAIDTRTSVSMGLGALVFATVAKLATMVLFVVMSTYAAPWHIPTGTWWSWVLLFVVVDLAWYCDHRFSHRVRIGWAAHQAHHSSEYFNLGTALRQKWNPWSEAIFWLPLPVLGFAPWTIYVAFAFNLIYQFFTHTETIGRLPRPLEFVLNTPSHHRVHHGSDPEYLDRNYGGILIVWDRMFGTFQQEMHTPTYGLTKPVGTYNVLKLQYHEYGNIIRDVRTARGWRDKLGHISVRPVGGPGASPNSRRRPATWSAPCGERAGHHPDNHSGGGIQDGRHQGCPPPASRTANLGRSRRGVRPVRLRRCSPLKSRGGGGCVQTAGAELLRFQGRPLRRLH